MKFAHPLPSLSIPVLVAVGLCAAFACMKPKSQPQVGGGCGCIPCQKKNRR